MLDLRRALEQMRKGEAAEDVIAKGVEELSKAEAAWDLGHAFLLEVQAWQGRREQPTQRAQ